MGFFRSSWNRLQGKKEGSIRKEWAFDTHSEMLARPLSFRHDGKLYVAFGTASGTFYLLGDHAEVVWSFSARNDLGKLEGLFLDKSVASGIFSTPALLYLDKATVPIFLFGSDDFSLYALNFDGSLRWRFKSKGAIRTTPLIRDIDDDGKEEIIFGSRDGNLYSIDQDGIQKMGFKAASGIDSSPAIIGEGQDRRVIFGSDDGTVYALDKSFSRVWEFRTGGKITAQPAVADLSGDGRQEIIIGSFDGRLYVLGFDGSLRWRYETEGGIAAKVSVYDVNSDGKPEILFGSSDDRVYCLSCTGNKIWDFEADFWVVDTPHVIDLDSDGRLEVVVGSLDSTLYVLDGEGSYSLQYMPGIAGITQQSGHYNETISQDVGDYAGKRLWQAKTDGMVIGADVQEGCVIVGTKNGTVEKFSFNR